MIIKLGKHVLIQNLGALLDKLRRSKDAEKNRIQVSLVRNGLRDLIEEIQEMGKYVKDTEKPNEIVDIVEKFLEFNEQNKPGQRLKIVAPTKCSIDYKLIQVN